MKKFRLLFQHFCATVVLLLMVLQNAYAATLVSSVNRNSVGVNETITLSVQYDKQVNSSKLSLDALDADFDVLSVSPQTSSSTSYVNGKVTKEELTIWRITLAPKRKGDLIIPQLSFDGDKSRPITIKVQDVAPTATAGSNEALNVLVSTNASEAYVGQQLLLEVEISAAENVANLNGPQLEIDGADVELLNQLKTQRLENGLIRQVITLKYVIFSNQPGKVVIPTMIYTATQGGRRSVFDTQRGKRVLARSAPLEVNIKPVDTTYSPWFPAEKVSIKSLWSGDISNMKVGEPMTRTVIVTAHGQRASTIPPLRNTVSSDYKSYKDQAQLDDGKTDDGYVSTRVESEAIVVSSEGELILPEQRIRWWDVNKGQWKEAILPSELINVAASTTINNNQINEQPLTPQRVISNQDNEKNSHWLWPLLCAFLALICFVQAWFIFQLKKQPSLPEDSLSKPQALSEAKSWKALKKALTSSDPQSIRQAILTWGQSFTESRQFNTLDKLSEYSNDAELNIQLKQAFNSLEASLYKDNVSFDAQGLEQHMASLKNYIASNKHQASVDAAGLKPLYKS